MCSLSENLGKGTKSVWRKTVHLIISWGTLSAAKSTRCSLSSCQSLSSSFSFFHPIFCSVSLHLLKCKKVYSKSLSESRLPHLSLWFHSCIYGLHILTLVLNSRECRVHTRTLRTHFTNWTHIQTPHFNFYSQTKCHYIKELQAAKQSLTLGEHGLSETWYFNKRLFYQKVWLTLFSSTCFLIRVKSHTFPKLHELHFATRLDTTYTLINLHSWDLALTW